MHSIHSNKKANLTQTPKNQKHIYSISIDVGEEISKDIGYFRDILQKEVRGKFRTMDTDPHLPLMGFRMDASYEKELIYSLWSFATSEKGFCINLRDFDLREWSNAVYAGILDYASLAALFTRIRRSIRKHFGYNQFETDKPSIAIGKWLDADQFSCAKRLFSTLEYANAFWVDSFTLMKQAPSGQLQPVRAFDMNG